MGVGLVRWRVRPDRCAYLRKRKGDRFGQFATGGRGVLLVGQQFLFQRYSAGGGKTAEAAIVADDPVTADYKRQGVFRHYRSDCPCRTGSACSSGKPAVAYCFAKSYVSKGRQNSPAELARTGQAYGDIFVEPDVTAFEI